MPMIYLITRNNKNVMSFFKYAYMLNKYNIIYIMHLMLKKKTFNFQQLKMEDF